MPHPHYPLYAEITMCKPAHRTEPTNIVVCTQTQKCIQAETGKYVIYMRRGFQTYWALDRHRKVVPVLEQWF